MQEMWTPFRRTRRLFLHMVMRSADALRTDQGDDVCSVWLLRMDPMKRPQPRSLAARIGDNMDYLDQLMTTRQPLRTTDSILPTDQLPLFQQETVTMLKTQGRKMPLTIERRRLMPGSRQCPSCHVDTPSESFWTLHYRYDGRDSRDLLRCSHCTYTALEREYRPMEASTIAMRKGLVKEDDERF